MKMIRRNAGSQRSSSWLECKFFPNVTGSGGQPDLILRTSEGNWITFIFDNEAEVHELLSQAHIIHHNFTESK